MTRLGGRTKTSKTLVFEVENKHKGTLKHGLNDEKGITLHLESEFTSNYKRNYQRKDTTLNLSRGIVPVH